MKLLRYLWISAKHLVLYGRLTVWIASDDETWRALRHLVRARLLRVQRRRESRLHPLSNDNALGAFVEELVLAGFPSGDRTVALANLRQALKELAALKAALPPEQDQ